MLIAGSLSIEPFGPSRWRWRRTRSGQLCRFNRESPGQWAGRGPMYGPITTATRSRAAVARSAGSSNSHGGYTSGAGAAGRDRSKRARGRRRLRGVMCDAREERVKEELSCRQPFDKAHGGTAAGTWPRHSWWCGDGRFDRWRWGAGKRLATLRQPAGAAPRREEAAIADADEALREDVQEEATEKFVDVERQRPPLASVAVVLPPKRPAPARPCVAWGVSLHPKDTASSVTVTSRWVERATRWVYRARSCSTWAGLPT